jgi:hypothetical protein
MSKETDRIEAQAGRALARSKRPLPDAASKPAREAYNAQKRKKPFSAPMHDDNGQPLGDYIG